MLFLAETIIKAAGFRNDSADDTWTAPEVLRPVVTVQCDESDIMDALLEVHAFLEANGISYNNLAINGRYVSIVGLTGTKFAAVA